ncbi:MAG: MBL fold metallo-hydrolase [Opitutaceae bacterium]|jgi:glyoxylase-like metal-dependent hydrolase (beta-lactamase superfamily II)
MARIPLEDDFNDVINKAQRGRKLSNEQLAAQAGVTLEALEAVKQGDPALPTLRRVAPPLGLSPGALEALAQKAWYPEQPVFPHGFAMFNTYYPHEGISLDIRVNSYLVWDARTRTAAAFDTGANCFRMLELVKSEKLVLLYVFLTHTHEDHVADLDRLACTSGATVWASELEPAPFHGSLRFKENSSFTMGGIAIKTLLTSGHSPGQTTYFITGLSWPLAIVGDSLFASSIGGSEDHFAEQYDNDRKKIFALPRDTVIAPGHGPLTTVAQELKHNPFFAHEPAPKKTNA